MRIEHKLLIPLFLLIVSNTLTAIEKNSPIVTIIIYIVFFVAVGIAIQIKKIINHKHSISIILLLSSIMATITAEGFSVLLGMFFLTYSAFIIKLPKKIYLYYGAIETILLMVNFSRHNYTSANTIGYMAGILFVFIIYQDKIHPKKIIKECIKPDYLIYPVKKDIVDTIRLIILGYQYNEINDKLELSITDDQVRRNVNKEVKRLGFRNREHMIFFLTEKGIIKSISYDLDSKIGSHDKLE